MLQALTIDQLLLFQCVVSYDNSFYKTKYKTTKKYKKNKKVQKLKKVWEYIMTLTTTFNLNRYYKYYVDDFVYMSVINP